MGAGRFGEDGAGVSKIDFDEFLQRAVMQAGAADDASRRRALYQNARETLLKKAATATEPTGRLLLEFENAVDRVERRFAAGSDTAAPPQTISAPEPASARPQSSGRREAVSSRGGAQKPSERLAGVPRQSPPGSIELPPPPVFPEFPQEPGYDDPLTSRRKTLEKALGPAVKSSKDTVPTATLNGAEPSSVSRPFSEGETDPASERFPSFLTAFPRGLSASRKDVEQPIRAQPLEASRTEAVRAGAGGDAGETGMPGANDPEWLETVEASGAAEVPERAGVWDPIRRYGLPVALLAVLMSVVGAGAYFGVRQLSGDDVPGASAGFIPAADNLTGEGWRVIDAIAEDTGGSQGGEDGRARVFRLIDDSTVRLGRVSAPLNEAAAPRGFLVSVNLEKVDRRVANFALVQVAYPLTRDPITFGAMVDLLTGDVSANGQASEADISVIDDGTSWRIVLSAPMPEGVLFGKPLLEIFPAAGVSLQTLDPRATGVIGASNIDVSAL